MSWRRRRLARPLQAADPIAHRSFHASAARLGVLPKQCARPRRLGPVDVGPPLACLETCPAAGKLATGPVVASLARMTVWITNWWCWFLSCPQFVSFRFVLFHPRLLHADAVVMDRQGRGLLPRPPTALGLGLTGEVFKKRYRSALIEGKKNLCKISVAFLSILR